MASATPMANSQAPQPMVGRQASPGPQPGQQISLPLHAYQPLAGIPIATVAQFAQGAFHPGQQLSWPPQHLNHPQFAQLPLQQQQLLLQQQQQMQQQVQQQQAQQQAQQQQAQQQV